MPNLTIEDINMIGGGNSSDPRTGPGSPPITVTGVPPTEPGPPITVTGVPPTEPPPPPTGFLPPPTGGGGGGGPPSPPPTPPPPPNAPPPRKVADYKKNCTSANGSAVDIGRALMGLPPAGVSGPPGPTITDPEGHDWTQVEFDAYVQGSGGSYTAVNNAIYSNDSSTFATIPNPPPDTQGLLHNHPTRGDSGQQNIDKYPSDEASGGHDWEALQQIADRSGNPNPSLWILGPDGVIREFKLSDRGYWQSLTPEQMKQGTGLAGTERNTHC
jgi:hypothetical protein